MNQFARHEPERVRRRGSHFKDKDTAAVSAPSSDQGEIPHPCLRCATHDAAGDWTALPDDTVVQLFSRLNYRDRASLASTCRAWRLLGSSPCLWASLDLCAHGCESDITAVLAGRCAHLRRLRFHGSKTASDLIHLQARGLREIAGDYCCEITDVTLSVIAARHEALESLQIGPCVRITSDAVRHVAMCCTGLKRLRLTGIRDVNGEAVNALARQCPRLSEIAFLDCGKVDEAALVNVVSLRFLSIAGSRNIQWATASLSWSSLPNLVGLDVSRTDVSASAVLRLLSVTKNLQALCALNCSAVDEEGRRNPSTFINTKGKLFLTQFTDVLRGIASLFKQPIMNEQTLFVQWRNFKNKDKNLNDIMIWLEWILSHSLLRIAESNPHGMDEFWLRQGASMLLRLAKSSQEDVQERAATGLATFVVTKDDNAAVEPARAEAVMQNGGIPLLLELARSCREGVQFKSAKAIAILSLNSKIAKAVADEGGIGILSNLARSSTRLVAKEAAGGLWNLSVGEEHKAAIAEAGGVKALVDLIFKWQSGAGGVLVRAAGALANLAADDKCNMEIAVAGGVCALVTLAKSCKIEGVRGQAARALANLSVHGDCVSNTAAVGQESGALEALVQLTYSQNEGVRQEAAHALWNLTSNDRNLEAIALAGGVEALVALAHSSSNACRGLQVMAAGALLGLSVSEANRIAIGREGGVAPLIALARSDTEDVHETASGALWNLAFNSGNALRIIEEGGVPVLVQLCSSSGSKMARFMAAQALAYMFDGRMDEVALVGSLLEGSAKSVNFNGARKMALKQIEEFLLSFSDPHIFSAAASLSAPATLAQVVEAVQIQEAGHLRFSAEIGRYVSMLQNPSSILRACAAFAIVQFTLPGGQYARHNAGLLQNAGASRVLRASAAAATAPIESKMYARIVLRNLEHHLSTPPT